MAEINGDKLLREAIRCWGEEFQILMAIEEMSELTQGLLHHLRKNKEVSRLELAEEIADVKIMMEQLEIVFDVKASVIQLKEDKLKRLERMIKSANKQC